MAKFVFLGDKETGVFGLLFPPGVPVEVTDEKAAQKLRGHPEFVEEIEGVQIVEKRRGRPPKVR